MKDTRFAYSIVRFVPDTVRGEFANVAIVLVGPTGSFQMRNADLRLARFLDAKGIFEKAMEAHDARAIRDEADLNRYWRNCLGVIQYTRPAPILATSETEALATIAVDFFGVTAAM